MDEIRKVIARWRNAARVNESPVDVVANTLLDEIESALNRRAPVEAAEVESLEISTHYRADVRLYEASTLITRRAVHWGATPEIAAANLRCTIKTNPGDKS